MPPSTTSANLPVPRGWGNRDFTPPPTSRGVSWRRYGAAIRRYKWMIAGVTAAGAIIGFILARASKPEYETKSRIWIASESYRSNDDRATPLGERQILDAAAWSELLTSNMVLDSVVQQLSLFVAPTKVEDSDLFTGSTPFRSRGNHQPGSYTLVLDGQGRYALRGRPRGARTEETLETGLLGSPVGRKLGFDWTPPRLRDAREIEFQVTSLRQAAIDLAERLKVTLGADRAFLVLSLSGDDPERDASILNAVARQFVETTMDIKRSKEALLAGALAAQVQEAERNLRQSEQALERFRTATITLPRRDLRRYTPVDDPATADFQALKRQADSLARDRGALQRLASSLRGGRGANAGAVLAVPAARSAPELQAAVADLQAAETELQSLRRTFTSEYPRVRALEQSINRLRTQTIPQQINVLIARLGQQQREAASYASRSAGELRGIPRRELDDQRLARTVAVNESLYTVLRDRYQRARAAEASVVPDVSVFDPAVAPIRPTGNSAPALMALAIIGSLLAAIILAILLDRFDPSFRYPEQIQELGLSMLGAVPHLKGTLTVDSADEDTLKAVESFRELRMNLRHAQPTPGPTIVTITSPGENDGKSLLASNLATAFADAGYRTLLIDGDVRRGRLHDQFNVEQSPGLTDLLAGQARPDQIARRTPNEKLLVIPAGSRAANAPELLMSDGLRRLLLTAGPVFDVVLVDSPPLGAGADPFALGVASTNMLMVLRAGKTDRQMAAAKLDILDRLPVRVLGAVLNDIEPKGVYKYYSYLDGYAASGAQLVPVPAHAHAAGAYHET